MKGILKRGVVIGLIAMFGSTACTEDKKDNSGLLLAGLLLGQTSEWSVTMSLRVKTSANANMAAVADNRVIEFTQGANSPLVLTSGETIKYLATSTSQAGAGIVQVAFKINKTAANINFTTTSLNSGANADLIASYTTAAGSGSFIFTPDDTTPTATSQVSNITQTGVTLEVISIVTVKTGTYNLASPTTAENLCDGKTNTTNPVTKSGTIAAAETWSGNILLSGTVNITAAVTVSAGTVIFGPRGSSIAVYNGGSIVANGTAASPVCFTSANAPGSRQPGDWGGIVIVGNGYNNRTGTLQSEGTTPLNYPGTSNSASRFSYTIVEFAGNEVAPGDELNGISMYAVNEDKTNATPALNRVQIHRGLDDSFEWWGGNISGQYLIATGGLDDDFDADEGYGVDATGASTATLKNLIGMKYPASCGGTPSTDPQGFEMDGVGSGTARTTCTAANSSNPASTSCHTNPAVSNFTLIGVKQTSSIGMQLREGMRGTFTNGLVYGFAGVAVSCIRGGSFPNSLATFTNVVYGDASAPVNTDSTGCVISGITSSLTATPITSLGNVADTGCGFGATKPNFTIISTAPNRGHQAEDNTAWWSDWTVYRAR